MMFSYTKSFMGKRKVSLQIEESSWSDKFTLDTIEDADKVTCKSGKNAENYHVGVQINMSKSSLTKIITFTPYYLLHNTMEYAIEICELEQLDPNWLEIGKTFISQCGNFTIFLLLRFYVKSKLVNSLPFLHIEMH